MSEGKKISELLSDDIVTGDEMIPVSDNGVTKFITVRQLLDSITTTTHEVEQSSYISKNTNDIQDIKNNMSSYNINTTQLWEEFK